MKKLYGLGFALFLCVVFAQDPVTGVCCMYPDPCSAPEGWTIYSGPGCQDYTIEG
jgi:hypothetical protein